MPIDVFLLVLPFAMQPSEQDELPVTSAEGFEAWSYVPLEITHVNKAWHQTIHGLEGLCVELRRKRSCLVKPSPSAYEEQTKDNDMGLIF